jgi:S-adenosylmethionine synthetase
MGMRAGALCLSHTAECVSPGHPDKFMDRVADAILDAVLKGDREIKQPQFEGSRVAVEGVVIDNQLMLMGEVTTHVMPDLRQIARRVWEATGYGHSSELVVLDNIVKQSPERKGFLHAGGADEQGIMIGYATNETPEMLPKEFIMARRLCDRALQCRDNGSIPWMRADIKTQVTLNADGKVTSAVLTAQHEEREGLVVEHWEKGACIKQLSEPARQELLERVLHPVLSEHFGDCEPTFTINGAGSFAIGGPHADAGNVGRKIVVDAYGPRVPVGGGAYSGKDPAKVDRGGAYIARYVAKTLVSRGMARKCLVTIAYAIGKTAPEMITAITEEGRDWGDWVRDHFDFAPWAIIERLGLWKPKGWSYYDTATYGHYGYEFYPWERVE